MDTQRDCSMRFLGRQSATAFNQAHRRSETDSARLRPAVFNQLRNKILSHPLCDGLCRYGCDVRGPAEVSGDRISIWQRSRAVGFVLCALTLIAAPTSA